MASPIIDEAISTLDQIDAQSLRDNPYAGAQLIEAARRMISRLESPFMQIVHTSLLPASVHVALMIVSDLGLWEAWREAGGKESTLTELWDLCKVSCDMALFRRLLLIFCVMAALWKLADGLSGRLLLPVAAAGFLVEVGEDCWSSTPTSLALGDKESPAYNAMIAWSVCPTILLSVGLYFMPVRWSSAWIERKRRPKNPYSCSTSQRNAASAIRTKPSSIPCKDGLRRAY